MAARLAALAGAAALIALMSPGSARAQSDDQVYSWETPQPGWIELRAFGTLVADSAAPYERFGGASSREGLQQHFVELGYGVSDRWEADVYADFERSPDGPFRYSGVRLESNYRFFERYQRLLELGVHAELRLPRGSSDAPQELELLAILQRDFGDFRLVVDPGFDYALSGDEASEGLSALIRAGFYFRRFWLLQPGVEYFADLGPLAHPPPLGQQRHVIYPALRVRIVPGMDWLLAVGFGLDRASDRVVLRTLFSYELETIRPADQRL